MLFRVESERLKLPAPLSRWIAEALDADAAREPTFYGCFDKVGCEEGERDGQRQSSNRTGHYYAASVAGPTSDRVPMPAAAGALPGWEGFVFVVVVCHDGQCPPSRFFQQAFTEPSAKG